MRNNASNDSPIMLALLKFKKTMARIEGVLGGGLHDYYQSEGGTVFTSDMNISDSSFSHIGVLFRWTKGTKPIQSLRLKLMLVTTITQFCRDGFDGMME